MAAFTRFVLVTMAAALLTACGFHLRGDASLPPEMTMTQMVVDDEYSTLARRVRLMLEQTGVRFVGSDQATAILEIPTNRVVTEVLEQRKGREALRPLA